MLKQKERFWFSFGFKRKHPEKTLKKESSKWKFYLWEIGFYKLVYVDPASCNYNNWIVERKFSKN